MYKKTPNMRVITRPTAWTPNACLKKISLATSHGGRTQKPVDDQWDFYFKMRREGPTLAR